MAEEGEIQEGEINDTPNETEELAKKYGWRPREEFDLDPEGFVEAEKFLEFSSTQVRILRDEANAQKAEFEAAKADMDKRVEALTATTQMALKRQEEQMQEAHKRELERIHNEQIQAVQEMDTDRFEKLKKEEADLKPVQASTDQIYVDNYRKENEWVNDPLLWKIGIDAVSAAGPAAGESIQEQLKYAEEKVKDLYPHKFAAPVEEKPQITKIDPGGLGGGINTSDDMTLPPEAKAAAKEFIEMGLYKDEAEYAKDYFSGATQ